MKAVGIVVEYNPFHNGHLYHVQQAKEITNADVVIAVMSTSFLQRGEPAIISKWYRAKMALLSGVDIVVELPYVYSTQKAEIFAKGAMSILHALHVSYINFGSESGKIEDFETLVSVMDEKKHTFNTHVKKQMAAGVSYPQATAEAFEQLHLGPSVLSLNEPNNILGYHYVKAIRKRKYNIIPTTTLRKQAQYNDETISSKTIASATSIRKAMKANKSFQQVAHVMPEEALHLLKKYVHTYSTFHTWEQYFSLLQYKITSTCTDELERIYECEEGLEFRVKKTMKHATSFFDWMKKMKTKRYTWTRLQRLATHILTNTTKEEITLAHTLSKIPYIRLLGMSKKGQMYLSETKKSRTTPLITRQSETTSIWATLDERATNVYLCALPQKERIQAVKEEFSNPPIRI